MVIPLVAVIRRPLPWARWLRILMNRLDPKLFAACFRSWVRAAFPGVPELVAIDGKTSRGSHDRSRGREALHLVSAFATLRASGHRTRGGERGRLRAGDHPRPGGRTRRLGKPRRRPRHHRCHGRVEECRLAVSTEVDWLESGRRFPGDWRLPKIAAAAMAETVIHAKGKTSCRRRFFVASRALSAAQAAHAVRGHWAIENSLHWVLDVVFNEDKCRGHTAHGPANMALIRHFAFNLLRPLLDKRSLKLRRKRAARRPQYLAQILQSSLR
jgi:predicted transposase YbfD/YdcC